VLVCSLTARCGYGDAVILVGGLETASFVNAAAVLIQCKVNIFIAFGTLAAAGVALQIPMRFDS
jgi:hypothetical protein